MEKKRYTPVGYSLGKVCSTSRLFLCLILLVVLSLASMYWQVALSGAVESASKDKTGGSHHEEEGNQLKRVKRLPSSVVLSAGGIRASYRPQEQAAVRSSYSKQGTIKTLLSNGTTSIRNVNRALLENSTNGIIVSDARLGSQPNTPHYLVIILIHSSIGEIQRRRTIRETWLSPLAMGNTSYTYWFVIGGKEASKEVQNDLQQEQNRYGDLLILWDVRNDYLDLTKRSLYSMVHLSTHNYRYSYLLKTDDDVFLNTPTIMSELRLLNPRQRIYWGRFSCHNPPMEAGRWEERGWHWCDVYYPYAYGGMYILSKDVVSLITTNANSLQFYSCEDVSLGVWLAPFNLHRINDGRIFIQHNPKCSRGYIAVHIQHRLSYKLMMKYYDNLKRKGIICSTLSREEILLWDGLPHTCMNTTKIVI